MSAITLILLVAPIVPLYAQQPGEQAPQRSYPVLRLKPAAFQELPKSLVTELQRRGCTIPQPYTDRKANVIRAQFARPGQTDWAVLCSRQGSTSVLVFWNGSAENALALEQNPDDPRIIFDWYIRPVGRKFIMEHYRAYGGPKPPPVDHEGIETGGESASVVLYFYRGKWLKLQGAD